MQAEPSSLLLHLTKNALEKEKEVKKEVKKQVTKEVNKPSIFKYSWADWPSDSEDEDY
jgi:beta-galactosidase/beta-glucuronidase